MAEKSLKEMFANAARPVVQALVVPFHRAAIMEEMKSIGWSYERGETFSSPIGGLMQFYWQRPDGSHFSTVTPTILNSQCEPGLPSHDKTWNADWKAAKQRVASHILGL